MLTPEQLDHYPDSLVELCAQVEADILADMARKINAYDYYTAASAHQKQKLVELGNTYDDIMKRLSAVSGKSKEELRRIMQEAGTEALKNDDDIYKAAGLSLGNVNQSPALQAVLLAGLDKTNGLFKNLTNSAAAAGSRQFERALDLAYMQVTTGAFSHNEAIKHAIKQLSKSGLEAVVYNSGRVEHLDVAVRRAVLTGVNQTAAKLQIARADEMSCDLVEVTAHAGARPSHAVWQGGIYSRSGKSDQYESFEYATGYGTGAGLCGWNCRHSFFPYFEGVSRPAYTPEELERFNAKNYEYNGVKMTEYEASQKQRYIERQIRRWKREDQAMQAAKLPTEEAKAKIAHWNAVQKDFLEKTGLKRQYDREWAQKATDRLSREVKRKDKNAGSFAALTIPMQKRSILKVAEKYGVSTKGLTLKIQRNEKLLALPFFGSTDYTQIGRIDFFPNAFMDEEQLIRTLLHEKCHVLQLRRHGMAYAQNNLAEMEKQAERYENLWYTILRKRVR